MHRLIKIGIIYLAFVLRGFSFILLAPVYTRALDPSTWGGVLAAQSLFLWLTLLLEYGFSLSFTRKVAATDKISERSRLFSSVLSAKILLVMPSMAMVFLLSRFGILQDYKDFAWLALLMAILQTFSPLWYYQATEKMHVFSIIDSIFRFAYIIGCLVFIRTDSDAAKIFIFQSIGFGATLFASMHLLWKNGMKFRFSYNEGIAAIKEGFSLASYTLITGIYTSLSVLILGAFASSHTVAIYGSSDRIVRAGLSVMGPVNQLILPRSARAFRLGFPEGVREFKKILIGYGLGSLIAMLLTFALAAEAVKLLFGPSYASAVELIHMLSILFPIIAINTVLTYHFLVPNNLDVKIVQLYTLASFTSLISMLILVPRYEAYGMIASVILPEVLVLCLAAILVRRKIKLGSEDEK